MSLGVCQFFKKKGHEIMNAKIMPDLKKKTNYGYLNFKTKEEAVKCLQQMQNVEIEGRQIVLTQKWDSQGKFDSEANLLVKNLPLNMTQKELQELFATVGKVVSCKLEMGSNNKSR